MSGAECEIDIFVDFALLVIELSADQSVTTQRYTHDITAFTADIVALTTGIS